MSRALDIGVFTDDTRPLEAEALAAAVAAAPEHDTEEALGTLLVELAALARAGVKRAQGLMRARELEEMLRRSAAGAVDKAAADSPDDGTIDRAVSMVRAADDARLEGNRALALWIEHLERVDSLSRAAERALTRPA